MPAHHRLTASGLMARGLATLTLGLKARAQEERDVAAGTVFYIEQCEMAATF